MKPSPKMGKASFRAENTLLRQFGPFVLYGLITLLVVVLYTDNHRVFASWELAIQDVMVSLGREPDPPTNVVVVEIDDNAVETLGPWPWDSERIGYLVGMLAEYKTRAIGLDVELPTELMEDPEGNLFLAEMIEKAGNVVLPLRFTLTDDGRLTQTAPDYVKKSSLVVLDEAARLMDYPYPQSLSANVPYPEAAKAAWALGHVNTWQDVDGRVRRDPLVVNYEGNYYPSMALQLARLATNVNRLQLKLEPGESILLGKQRVPTDDAGMMRIDFRGPARTVPSVSAAKVLEGADLGTQLAGKIVVVGVAASGYGATLRTGASEELPRAEKSANVVANILEERYVKSVSLSTFFDLLILAAIGALCAVVLPRTSLLNRIIVLVVLGFVFVNLNFALYQSFKLTTNTLYPTIEILLFLAFAPFVKPKREGALASSVKPDGSETAGRVVISASRSALTPSAAGSIPAGSVAETLATGVTSPTDETVTVEQEIAESKSPTPEPLSPVARRVSGGTKSDAGITLTPSFEPLGNETLAQSPTLRSTPAPIPEPVDLGSSGPSRPAMSSGATPTMASGPLQTDLKRLGRYEILGVLGQGAMGVVLKGRDPAIDRLVALKTIRVGVGIDPAQATELRERLVREAKAAGKLSHPNIVTIYDVGTEGDLDYIAMEFLEGHTLESLIQKRTVMNYRLIAKMLHQVCGALDYAHKMGIVHRDIKPANIMVLEGFDVKVTDFGIARFESGAMSMTQTGIAMGTPYYIAPEQLRGEAVDRRCDIFSLGVVAYELLTATRPFDGKNISALVYAVTQVNPDPPSRKDASIPGLFDFVVGKALSKDPRKRYQSANDMGKDLEAFVEDMAGAKAYKI